MNTGDPSNRGFGGGLSTEVCTFKLQFGAEICGKINDMTFLQNHGLVTVVGISIILKCQD